MTKLWIGTLVGLLYWMPWDRVWHDPVWDDPSGNDVYFYGGKEVGALAVVTPDPFAEPEDGIPVWRAEVHVRVEDSSVVWDVPFRASRLREDTVLFRPVADGLELLIFEEPSDQAPGSDVCLRWHVSQDGLIPLYENRGTH